MVAGSMIAEAWMVFLEWYACSTNRAIGAAGGGIVAGSMVAEACTAFLKWYACSTNDPGGRSYDSLFVDCTIAMKKIETASSLQAGCSISHNITCHF